MTAIVLVHGGFVDGSGWESVYQILKEDGHSVSIVQNPTLSLAGDVAATKRVLDAQNAPIVLVGHSYGGAVITEAGNDPPSVSDTRFPSLSRPRSRREPGRLRSWCHLHRLWHVRCRRMFLARRACGRDSVLSGRRDVGKN